MISETRHVEQKKNIRTRNFAPKNIQKNHDIFRKKK